MSMDGQDLNCLHVLPNNNFLQTFKVLSFKAFHMLSDYIRWDNSPNCQCSKSNMLTHRNSRKKWLDAQKWSPREDRTAGKKGKSGWQKPNHWEEEKQNKRKSKMGWTNCKANNLISRALQATAGSLREGTAVWSNSTIKRTCMLRASCKKQEGIETHFRKIFIRIRYRRPRNTRSMQAHSPSSDKHTQRAHSWTRARWTEVKTPLCCAPLCASQVWITRDINTCGCPVATLPLPPLSTSQEHSHLGTMESVTDSSPARNRILASDLQNELPISVDFCYRTPNEQTFSQ